MTEQFDYQLIRSNRKTMAIQISPKGLVVRAPYRTSQKDIDAFVQKHSEWIKKHLEESEKKQENSPEVEKMSMEEIRELAEKAAKKGKNKED